MPFQPQKGDSCGACAASYVLEEFGIKTFKSFAEVDAIWGKVKFGKNSAGLSPDYSDPTRIARQLKAAGVMVQLCMQKSSSPLSGYIGAGVLKYEKDIQDKDGTPEIQKDASARAICIYTPPANPNALHFMLTRYSSNHYEVIDSNDKAPAWKAVNSLGDADGYSYLDACIVAKKKK